MGALLSNLNAAHDGYQLRVADALWAEKDYTFLDAFLKLTNRDYGAGFNQVDFKGATEAARLTINQWVEQKTDNKIKDLLQPGTLNPFTRLVLTNAIYFKGDWQTPFDKALTRDEDFHLSPEQTIKAPLMHRTGGFNYFNGGTFQALEIPYKSAELPNDAGGLPALERSLTAYNMRQWLGQLRPAQEAVIVTLPKFKIEAGLGLGDTLEAMGMKEAFDGNKADFSGMAPRKTMLADGNLYISAVIHKAYVDVDEEGTEAAAATAVVHRAMSGAPVRHPLPPILFRVDHPFMFLIRDNRSGSILFIGRVTNPNPSQENLSQGDAARASTVAPDQQKLPTTYQSRDAEFDAAQQKLLQGAESIVLSPNRDTAEIIRSYPFLSGSLSGINTVRFAKSPGNGAGANLLFVYKLGDHVPDDYGQDGYGLDVYADDGTGYKKALSRSYMSSAIHVSRDNGQVALFIEVPPRAFSTGGFSKRFQNEWLLKGNSFVKKMRPFPNDCCGPRRPRQ
jgi:serpin B